MKCISSSLTSAPGTSAPLFSSVPYSLLLHTFSPLVPLSFRLPPSNVFHISLPGSLHSLPRFSLSLQCLQSSDWCWWDGFLLMAAEVSCSWKMLLRSLGAKWNYLKKPKQTTEKTFVAPLCSAVGPQCRKRLTHTVHQQCRLIKKYKENADFIIGQVYQVVDHVEISILLFPPC